MFLHPDELKTSMYQHVIDDITEGDEQMVTEVIEAAIAEISSYLSSRYDTRLIFEARGKDRNTLILNYTKTITIWTLIQVCSAETIYDMWKDRYDRAIDFLNRAAKGVVTPQLPLLTDESGDVKIKTKFGSNPKFRHNY
ncbi:MAG: DUF1320 domain-containing protein [Tannerellaceae bacterium]|nr:DUF1320 domain-containing protein [Tannerellaceae bacterium]